MRHEGCKCRGLASDPHSNCRRHREDKGQYCCPEVPCAECAHMTTGQWAALQAAQRKQDRQRATKDGSKDRQESDDVTSPPAARNRSSPARSHVSHSSRKDDGDSLRKHRHKDEKSASTRARRLLSVNDCMNRRRIKRSGLSLKLAARLHARRRKGTLVVISRNAHRVNSMTEGSATSVGRSRRLPSYSQMFKQGSLVSISRLASRERTTRIWSAPVACAVSRSVRI